MRRSERLDQLPPYLFAELERRKGELERSGRDIINLGIGDPDQAPPALLRQTLVNHLNDVGIHQYSSSQGIDEYREAIASYLGRHYGVELNPKKEVLMGIGSKELIAHLPLAVTNPGDVVILPEPGYPPYRSGTIFARCEPYVMPLSAGRGFLPELDAIPTEVARRAKILYVNYPNNPTGAVASREFYQRAIDFARKYDLLLVSDAAYIEIFYEERPVSVLQISGAKEVAIEVHSMTKTFSMAGWRMAWAAGNAEVLEHLRSLKANLDSGQFMGFQKAVAAVLRGGDEEIDGIREMYRRRRDVFVNGLRSFGWEVPMPKATFYVWFPVPKGRPSMEVVGELMDRAGVVLTPGRGFGEHGEGFLRAALTVPEDRLREAVERIAKFAR